MKNISLIPILACFALTGCNEPTMEGTYVWKPTIPRNPLVDTSQMEKAQEQRITFRGKEAILTFGGFGQGYSYQKEGKILTLRNTSGQILKLTIQEDGSLTSASTTYKKTE